MFGISKEALEGENRSRYLIMIMMKIVRIPMIMMKIVRIPMIMMTMVRILMVMMIVITIRKISSCEISNISHGANTETIF